MKTMTSWNSSGTPITTRSGMMPQVTMIGQKTHSWSASSSG